MKDALLQTTKALPAAGASNNHDGIDIGARAGANGIVPDGIELEIEWPALPSLADTKKVTFTVEDSADNSTFTAIGISKATGAGASSAGIAAGSMTFSLPNSTRRYVRVAQAVDSSGGDNTAKSVTVSLICRN